MKKHQVIVGVDMCEDCIRKVPQVVHAILDGYAAAAESEGYVQLALWIRHYDSSLTITKE